MSTPDNKDDHQSRGGKKKRRRVIVHPPEGTDPTPEAEPGRFSDDENLERLKNDKPPHWG